MESLARAFDQPLDSEEHRDLAENGWIGGADVIVRYWLGRHLSRNLFRESNDSVNAALREYFVEHGCEKGSCLVSDYQAWPAVAILLQNQGELNAGCQPTKTPRLVAAIQAVMADPELTNSELAAITNTTEKQVARMTDVFVLQKLWRQRKAQQVAQPDTA
jgi:hypothetical protein